MYTVKLAIFYAAQHTTKKLILLNMLNFLVAIKVIYINMGKYFMLNKIKKWVDTNSKVLKIVTTIIIATM